MLWVFNFSRHVQYSVSTRINGYAFRVPCGLLSVPGSSQNVCLVLDPEKIASSRDCDRRQVTEYVSLRCVLFGS